MEDELKVQTAALGAEFEALLGCYVELQGWTALFEACRRLAEKRQDGRVAGLLVAVKGYLSQDGV